MATMTSASYSAAFDARVMKLIEDGFVPPDVLAQCYNVRTTDKQYEIIGALGTFGVMPPKGEGADISVDSLSQRYTYTLTNTTYALGFRMAREMVEDNMFSLAERAATQLGSSASEAINVQLAYVLNNAFATVTYGDGSALCVTTHPTAGGTAANRPSSDADLGVSTLDAALVAMDGTIDHRGKTTPRRAVRIIGSTSIRRTALQLIGSTLEANSMDNNVNVFASLGLTGVFSPYITDTDAWFVQSADHGLTYQVRLAPEPGSSIDPNNGDALYWLRTRFAVGVEDWRGIYGSTGA